MGATLPYLVLAVLAGAALPLGLLAWIWAGHRRRLRTLEAELRTLGRRVPAEELRAREEELAAQMAQAREDLESRIRALEAERSDLQRRVAEADRDLQAARDRLVRDHEGLKRSVLGDAQVLGSEVEQLLGLAKTFDRWHAEVDALLSHNQEMHVTNQEFFSIVNQVVVLALNASIEASKAGVHGRGFRVVAEGVRDLALRMERLASEHNDNLHKNDLITTTTFQDLQAGGKMIMAAVVGLKVIGDKIQGRVAALDEVGQP